MSAISFSSTRPASTSWTGRSLSALVVLFMVFDTVLHLTKPAAVVQAFAQLQVPEHLSVWIGLLELACTILYAIPRTSVIGAVLLTGYLGGATAIQVRAGAAIFPTLFPSIVGALLWAGLLLRHEGLRTIVGSRPPAADDRL
jgi:DoxX-like protein